MDRSDLLFLRSLLPLLMIERSWIVPMDDDDGMEITSRSNECEGTIFLSNKSSTIRIYSTGSLWLDDQGHC